MRISKGFLQVGAWAALLSALTTATLMYGPNPPMPEGFDATQQLHANPLHLYKKWVLFLHPQFAFLAAMAAACILAKRTPALAAISLLYLAIWTITEMSQQAYLIDALNQMWRPAYLNGSGVDKQIWQTLIMGMRGISDSQYFIVIFCFGVGSVLMGAALYQQEGQARPLGVVNCAIGIMSLLAFALYYTSFSTAGPIVEMWYGWIYGPLQVGARLWLGWWLLTESRMLPTS